MIIHEHYEQRQCIESFYRVKARQLWHLLKSMLRNNPLTLAAIILVRLAFSVLTMRHICKNILQFLSSGLI